MQAILANQTGRDEYTDLGFSKNGLIAPNSSALAGQLVTTQPTTTLGNPGLSGTVGTETTSPLLQEGGYVPNLKFDANSNVTGVDTTTGIGLNAPVGTGNSDASWFSENKDMLSAGLGLGQLGLGVLNYNANKKQLESDLATAQQARQLALARAANKTGIQNKFQSVWS